MNEAVEADKDFIVRPMHASDLQRAIDWAAREGWNPGWHDAHCFRAADPGGFLIGELRGEPVGSISAVAYGEGFGFIGLYIVRPAFRGRGFGYRIWQQAIARLGARNIGLDGVLAQQANYAKSGFRLAYRNVRFEGVAPSSPLVQKPAQEPVQQRESGDAAAPVPLAGVPRSQLDAYDRTAFPAPRTRFLDAWLAQPEAVALASIVEGRLNGYGVLRRCRVGRKVGPLFADDAQTAHRLFDALLAHCPGETVALDVPEPNPAAIALAETHGMTSVFETARMYTRAAPELELAKIFGVTTFELG
jgi:GNAT superfamily N-acetyltransferase